MARCEICKFVRPNGSNLECHRSPPPWHSVGADDSCGEWRMNSRPLVGSAPASDDEICDVLRDAMNYTRQTLGALNEAKAKLDARENNEGREK